MVRALIALVLLVPSLALPCSEVFETASPTEYSYIRDVMWDAFSPTMREIERDEIHVDTRFIDVVQLEILSREVELRIENREWVEVKETQIEYTEFIDAQTREKTDIHRVLTEIGIPPMRIIKGQPLPKEERRKLSRWTGIVFEEDLE